MEQRQRAMMEMSLTMNPSEMKKIMEGSYCTSRLFNETTLNFTDAGSIIQATSPWKTTIDSLYVEFFEVLQSHSGGHDILEIISDLARCCTDTLKVIQSFKSKVAVGQIEEEIWLENERNTWRLLFILYQDRLLSQNIMDDDALSQYFGSSEKLCVESLFKRDGLVRESQLVIDWLEANNGDKIDQVVNFSDGTVGWENTLHQLQSAETIAFKSTREIVTEMDPDAPYHQNKPLHDLDVEDEKRMNQRIFAAIRCGKLEEAEKLCVHCGHSWKAVMFQGWRLFHNPNIKDNDEDDDGIEEEYQELEGNTHRDIWKNMAIKYCQQDYIGLYEKAAIASFCGYIDALLPVCSTWEDNLWAYMKAMVDIRVESEIRDCCSLEECYMPLPEEYWAQKMSLNQAFTCLESSTNPQIRDQSQLPEHIIQKHIILDELPKLLLQLDRWVDDSTISTHFLRFGAHLVLFLDQIGQGHSRESVEKILKAYIQRLTEMNQTQLVAFYVSKLGPSRQVLLYASYLEKIIDNDLRKESLSFAEDCGLDVFAITKQVVENIRNQPQVIEGTNLQHKVTEEDEYKISGLDWILFNENQRADALIQINALVLSFLILGKLDAAHLAFNKIPSDCVEQILSEGSASLDISQAIKEHLSYKAYLDAHEAFDDWFYQCKNKPIPPEELAENAQFPEKVAHQHRESQFKTETERWKITMSHSAKTAKTLLYNVLLFPEGWLVGAQDADYLRSICIPEIVLLLYSVLYESEMHEECVQLADVIAAEKHQLYKVYSKEKLGELLEKICESSVALMNAQRDPWGSDVAF